MNPLASPLSRLAHVVECVGWIRLPAVTVGWILRREFLITARSLDHSLPPIPAESRESWEAAAEPDLEALLEVDPTLTAAEIERWLADGQSCRVCRVGQEVAHWRWQITAPAVLRYLGCSLRPAPGDFVITEVLTHPEHCGRGVYARSALRALHEAKEAGCRRLVGFVAPWNRPAIQVMREVSKREVVGHLGYENTWAGRRHFAEGAAEVTVDGIRLLSEAPEHYTGAWPAR